MSDDRKAMKTGVLIAAIVIVLRIVLEQAGAPEGINNIFGVSWLYLILPVFFALGIRERECARPYGVLLKDVFLYAVYTRIMVMITYMLAYFLRWSPPRFEVSRGGNVGDHIGAGRGLVLIPVRNALFWIVMAVFVGMIIGSVVLLLKRRKTTPAAGTQP